MDEVGRAYAGMAAQYIDRFGTLDVVHPDDLALIDEHLSARADTVLDVGCGPGHLTAHLGTTGVDAVGIDLVREMVHHARAADAGGRYALGSFDRLPFADGSVAGILAWYSLIHTSPGDLDGVLAELRRVVAPGGSLVTGFFDGGERAAFDHQVVTAWSWPADELAARLRRAGFTEVERVQRPGVPRPGLRPHAAIAAVAG